MAASVLRLVALALVLYVLLAVAAHFVSLRMIFPRPPVGYAWGPEYLELRAADGTRLAARYWANPGAHHTLLFLHGNYEDLGTIGEYIPAFLQHGYAVFAFDYRRYGLSEGTPTESTLIADTHTAYEFLCGKLQVPPSQIVVFGYSLGGGPAIELSRRQPVAGLVLQGAFVSAYRVMTRWPLLPGDKFNNLARLPSVRCPVLVIHGTADGTVPFWHGERLFAAAPAPKRNFFVPGGPHAGLADFAGPAYWQALNQFTASLQPRFAGPKAAGRRSSIDDSSQASPSQ